MRRSVIVAVALLALLGVAGFASTRPPDRQDYRDAAVEVAMSAHDALSTAHLAGVALREGRVTALYVTVLLDSGTKRTAVLIGKLAELSPPDDDMRALRDEVTPLLAETVARLGDAARDPAGTADALTPLTERLSAFLDAHR